MNKVKSFFLLPFFLVLSISLFAQSKAEIKALTLNFRKEYKEDFLKEERSPFYGKEEELKMLSFYKFKPRYRFKCAFEATPDATPFDMATYSGKMKKYVQYGWLKFTFQGIDRKVAVYQNLKFRSMAKYKDYLFIPFKDLTNNKTTYGGGRYIDIKISDIVDNKIVVDFNQCYNPYCAFKGGYACPIPPKENHLDWAVKAGEKKFKGKH